MTKKTFSFVIIIVFILFVPPLAAQFCSAPEHCGLLSEGDLCRITNGNPSILPASNFDGDIFLNQCQNAEYVSDGNNWISCLSGQYILENVRGHDYFCNGTGLREEEEINGVNITTGNGLGSIIECCGSGFCNSNNAGIRLSTGQSITADSDITTITLTCPDDQQLIGLDDQGNIICEFVFDHTPITDLFSVPGTFSYVVPRGFTTVAIEVHGGGGGGGRTTCGGGGECFYGSGGGGAGGYASGTYSVTSGTTYQVIVGRGGPEGNDGVTSSFGGTIIYATGGNHGANRNTRTDKGGTGGQGFNGDVNIQGNKGTDGATGSKGIFKVGQGGTGINNTGSGGGQYHKSGDSGYVKITTQ